MSAVKSKNTKPEQLLSRSMWKLGLRYRKHYDIIGKPDFVFIRAQIAVFCDGDFWHGHNWVVRGMASLEEELARYDDFWRKKIERNVERDKVVTSSLEDLGWVVLRFWESDIKKSPEACAEKVKIVYDANKGM